MDAIAEFYDENGVLTLSFTDKVGRILGAVEVGLIAGAITDARFASGRPFKIFRGYNVPGERGLPPPSITIVGNVLSWTAADNSDPGVPNVGGLLIYGVY